MIRTLLTVLTQGKHKHGKTIPVCRTGNWAWTFEYSLVVNHEELNSMVREVFYSFDEKTQCALTKTSLRWPDRAQLWKQALTPVLPEKQCRAVMLLFLRSYIKCVRKRNAAERAAG